MKNNNKQVPNQEVISNYVSGDKAINLTTVNATVESPVYLIDKRLLDEMLSKVTKGSIEDIKTDLHKTIDMSATKESLFTNLDNYIYLDKIVQMLEPLSYNPDDNNIGMAADMVREAHHFSKHD